MGKLKERIDGDLVTAIEVTAPECILIVKALDWLSEHPEWLSNPGIMALKQKYSEVAEDLLSAVDTCRGCEYCVVLPKGPKCFNPDLKDQFDKAVVTNRFEDVTIRQPWCPLLEDPEPLPLDPDRYISEHCASCGLESFFQAKVGLCMSCEAQRKLTL